MAKGQLRPLKRIMGLFKSRPASPDPGTVRPAPARVEAQRPPRRHQGQPGPRKHEKERVVVEEQPARDVRSAEKERVVVEEQPARDVRSAEKEPLIVEGSAVRGTAEPAPDVSAAPPPAPKLRVPAGLRPDLPADVIKLAAQNAAFLQGILALQGMNLDEDLFQESIEDLRRKYYKERNKILHASDQQT